MAEELFIPKLGQTVEEVTLIEWHVQDGEKVQAGQEVLKVETDKAVFDVEATAGGYIHIGPFQPGQVVPVLTVVAVIGKAEDRFEKPVESPARTEATGTTPHPTEDEPQPANGSAAWIFASPIARKMASEHGINLAEVTPTGKNGKRIVAADIEAYLETTARQTPPQAQPTASAPAEAGSPAFSIPIYPTPVSKTIPLSGVRGVIASRMSLSSNLTAPVTLLMETDATELVRMRDILKEKVSAEWGFTPGYNDILAKITALALSEFPYMNARINGNVIEYLDAVNLGMAVDTERGLVVPVIRDTNRKTLYEFGRDFREAVERTRSGKASPEDLSGGTFTITNLGMYEVDAFTPVINLPEAAILGVGRITQKMVVKSGEAQIREMTTLSLVFDHRLVDGAPAARFLQRIKHLVENPYLMMAFLK